MSRLALHVIDELSKSDAAAGFAVCQITATSGRPAPQAALHQAVARTVLGRLDGANRWPGRRTNVEKFIGVCRNEPRKRMPYKRELVVIRIPQHSPRRTPSRPRSEPQRIGTSASGAKFTPNVPEPAGLMLAAQGVLAMWALTRAHSRVSRQECEGCFRGSYSADSFSDRMIVAKARGHWPRCRSFC